MRDGWHHVALTVAGGATAFYLDGALVHSGAARGAPPAAMPWHVMRNGTTRQFTPRPRRRDRGLRDRAVDAATIRAHFEAGRDVTDTTRSSARRPA